MDQTNLKKLAKELNLAVSTVSRALNDSYDISEETKKKVRALAKKLNYEPNPYARSLRQKSSKTIAVIIPEIANNFFALAINGIEEIAQKNEYHVLIYLTHETYTREAAILKLLSSGRVDGIIMSVASETRDNSHIIDISKNHIPIVFFDRICEDVKTVKVITNDYESGYDATAHLLQKGCTRPAYLSYFSNLTIDEKRLKGYEDALDHHKIPADRSHIINCDNNQQENYNKIKELLLLPDRPDGIFCCVEFLALTCYEVCHELQLNIPRDVKIISFSKLRTSSLLNPPLTTITQPAFDIGREAAFALFSSLGKRKEELINKKIILASTLIERESTKEL